MYLKLTRPATALAVVLLLGTPSALAQNDVLDDVIACRLIENDAERLLCFDAATDTLASASETGDIVAVSRQEIEAVERDSFGLSLPSLPSFSLGLRGRDNDQPRQTDISEVSEDGTMEVLQRADNGTIEEVRMIIESAEIVGRYWTFRMQNGQVWRFVEEERFRLPRSRGDIYVEISQAMMGSFMMQVNGAGRGYRVERVR